MRTSERGSALLTAMIAVVVIVIVAVGILRFASRASIGASAAANEAALVSCAEAARLQLMAQFHAIGFNPGALTALNVPLGTTGTGASPVALGGHYDTPAGSIVIDQVTYLPDAASGPNTTGARDLTSNSSLIGQGGKPVKVVVHCQNGSGRQLEVEFGIRFGL